MSAWLVPICVDNARVIFALYVAAMLLDFHFWGLPLGNDIPPYLVPLMGVTVLSAAYARPKLGHRLLGGNDLSYGLYIYHMPIVNLLINIGCIGSLAWVSLSLVASTVCAAGSWLLVERPFLRRKRAALRTVPAA
jgi:peptidoglycan/LPS O-acetylase OafA/YrhL